MWTDGAIHFRTKIIIYKIHYQVVCMSAILGFNLHYWTDTLCHF